MKQYKKIILFVVCSFLAAGHLAAETKSSVKTALNKLATEIDAAEYGPIDQVMVIHKDQIILNKKFSPVHDQLIDQSSYTPPEMYNYNNPDWHPFIKGTKLHTLQSVTKSVISIGLGLAIQNGHIKSVNDKALAYLEPYRSYITDQGWENITVKNLLTMRSGIDWRPPEGSQGYTANHPTTIMESSDHWVTFVMAKPLLEKPGTVFNYNDGVSVLLGEIVKQSTGMRADKYVAKHLFEPLGINNYFWKITPKDETDTEGGLFLETEDFIKIGQLFLHKGKWQDQQIVSEDWVKESVYRHVNLEGAPESLAYGYQWWLAKKGQASFETYSARGFGGQYLYIVPELDLVFAMNSWAKNRDGLQKVINQIIAIFENTLVD